MFQFEHSKFQKLVLLNEKKGLHYLCDKILQKKQLTYLFCDIN